MRIAPPSRSFASTCTSGQTNRPASRLSSFNAHDACPLHSLGSTAPRFRPVFPLSQVPRSQTQSQNLKSFCDSPYSGFARSNCVLPFIVAVTSAYLCPEQFSFQSDAGSHHRPPLNHLSSSSLVAPSQVSVSNRLLSVVTRHRDGRKGDPGFASHLPTTSFDFELRPGSRPVASRLLKARAGACASLSSS